MVTSTKTSINSKTKGMGFSVEAANTNLSSKYASQLYKEDNSKTNLKFENYKKENFNNVLSSKTHRNNENIQKSDKFNKIQTKDTNKAHELKESLKKVDEDSKSDSKDEINHIPNELLSLLNKLGIKEEDLKSNGEINSEVLKSMINGDTSSNSKLSDIMQRILELLKTDSSKNALDTDSLKLMEKLLDNLKSNFADDSLDSKKNIKSGLKDLMSEISSKDGKVLTLEDMLNKGYSQDNKDSSTENNNFTSKVEKDNKEVSKEEKFLNSLIDDDKDKSLNKINLFASRTQTLQNQGVDKVRGLTINKDNFTNDLIKDVKFMSTNSLKELTIKVNPGNLGEITIKLIQEDGVMKANLKANSKETTALLSQNLTDIKKQIGEQNIKIADVNIEIYKDDTTFFSEQGFGRQLSEEQGRNNSRNSSNDNKSGIIEDVIENNSSKDNNIEFFA